MHTQCARHISSCGVWHAGTNEQDNAGLEDHLDEFDVHKPVQPRAPRAANARDAGQLSISTLVEVQDLITVDDQGMEDPTAWFKCPVCREGECKIQRAGTSEPVVAHGTNNITLLRVKRYTCATSKISFSAVSPEYFKQLEAKHVKTFPEVVVITRKTVLLGDTFRCVHYLNERMVMQCLERLSLIACWAEHVMQRL